MARPPTPPSKPWKFGLFLVASISSTTFLSSSVSVVFTLMPRKHWAMPSISRTESSSTKDPACLSLSNIVAHEMGPVTFFVL